MMLQRNQLAMAKPGGPGPAGVGGRWAVVFGLLCAALTPATAAEAPVEFNRDIRTILTEHCYKCHGPDDLERKGGLRLDVRADALRPAKSGATAITPSAPDRSELLRRVATTDLDDRMPPVKAGSALAPAQIETLRRWIGQGAPYATHWAYATPTRPALPSVKHPQWPRNPVDQFLLARLEREGLVPSPEADRLTLARRLALDLTGLPPSPEAADRFVRDNRLNAYEAYVDELLAQPAFGEHWARLWLDLARYADSAGYADDTARTIWAYRDYVIRSFNANKHFDRFTIEQIAGDLLPDASEEDVIATAFHRNTMTNNEGGTDDEEFRNAAVIDRVNTTMAVWMGTSMACAQCHNHKYDPISQKEYFSVFAILNNTADADRNDEAPVLRFYTEREKAQRKALEAEAARLTEKLGNPTPELNAAQTEWEHGFARQPVWRPLERQTLGAPAKVATAGRSTNSAYVFESPVALNQLAGLRLVLDPAGSTNRPFVLNRLTAALLPPGRPAVNGRYVRIELPGQGKFLSLAEVQVFQGATNLARHGEATQSSTDFDGPARLAIDGNTDGHFAAAHSTTHTAQSDNPWWEVDLRQSASLDRIVVWNRADEGVEARLADFRVLVLNEKRETVWETTVHETPRPEVALTLDGVRPIAFSLAAADRTAEGSDAAAVLAAKPGGRKSWSPGKPDDLPHTLTLLADPRVTIPAGSTLRVTLETKAAAVDQSIALELTEDPALAIWLRLPADIATVLNTPADHRSAAQTQALAQHYRQAVAPGLQPTRDRLAAVQQELAGIKGSTVPVMRELTGDQRRRTRLQMRGNFKSLGDEVPPAIPAAFHPLPAAATPPDRLALARWLVDDHNPLTSRVLANRLWEQLFGIGIVRTSEDFGSQGERPTHPELLDWLATELVAKHWDMKQFLKLLVTSAAYRQSSRVTPELQERDPDNVWLARGPRARMTAEVVRDQALAVSGLLSPKMLGPSVRPPQPASGLSAAFGSSLDWKTSEGEDRYRRALYVEWRRTRPYPSLATFDAPNREVCIIRRPRSNTPLQALVTLNDPVFLEAARALGLRMARTPGTVADQITLGFRRCLIRPPTPGEVNRLAACCAETRAHFLAHPEAARQLAMDPVAPAPTDVSPGDLAAWTTVANVLLNLDETLMRP